MYFVGPRHLPSPLFPYTTLFRSCLEPFHPTPPRTVFRARLLHPDSREPVDDVLAACFPEPHSYTGENVVEISRSEEHTSELQSRQYLLCRRLLEKKTQQNERSKR